MTAIERAEHKGRARAISFYVFAAALLTALLAGHSGLGSDFVDGLWLGIAAVAALALMPWSAWLRPGNALARLLNDEGVREHRRMSCTAGFWTALAAALIVAPVAHDGLVGAYDVARVVATAALCAAMISFATLELRASR